MPKRSGYQYSYSGADCKVYAYLQGAEENIVPIESMNTISVSVHESKGQVRALGYRGIKGVSRGLRTIAGSMVLTIIEDHPLRELLIATKTVPTAWSIDRFEKGTGTFNDNFNFNNRIETLLPPFNILALYSAELHSTMSENPLAKSGKEAQSAGWSLEGVHIIDVGLVTSVHDIVSEMTISFIAEDYYPISLDNLNPPQAVGVNEDEEQEQMIIETQTSVANELKFYEYLFDYDEPGLNSPNSTTTPSGTASSTWLPE